MCHSFLIHSSDDWHLGCFHERVDFPGVQEKRTLFPSAFTSALWGSFLLALNEIQGHPMTFLIPLRWGYVLVLQSSPTLCDPMDCNPPGPSLPGILQARILGFVAIPFSRVSSQARNQTQISCTGGRFFTI